MVLEKNHTLKSSSNRCFDKLSRTYANLKGPQKKQLLLPPSPDCSGNPEAKRRN